MEDFAFADEIFESREPRAAPIQAPAAAFKPRLESANWFQSETAQGARLDLLRMRAAAAYARSDYETAATLYAEALELKPELLELLDALARVYLQLGKVPEAEELLNRMEAVMTTGDQQGCLWLLRKDAAPPQSPSRRRWLLLLHQRCEAEPRLWLELAEAAFPELCVGCQRRLRSALLLRALQSLAPREAALRGRIRECLDREPLAPDWGEEFARVWGKAADGNEATAFTYNSKVEERRDENRLLPKEEESTACRDFISASLGWILAKCSQRPPCTPALVAIDAF